MTVLPDFVVEEIRRRRESRAPIWNAAIIVGLVVAAGFTVAWMTLTPAPTYSNVARDYVEARLDRDWAAAWELMCRERQSSFGGFEAYAEQAEFVADFLFLPRDFDVSIGSTSEIDLPGLTGRTVAVTVTTDEREGWRMGGPVLVVAEEGELRVCAAPGLGE
jgi:hypothetical protein